MNPLDREWGVRGDVWEYVGNCIIYSENYEKFIHTPSNHHPSLVRMNPQTPDRQYILAQSSQSQRVNLWTMSARLNLTEIPLNYMSLKKKQKSHHNFPPEKKQNSASRKVSVGADKRNGPCHRYIIFKFEHGKGGGCKMLVPWAKLGKITGTLGKKLENWNFFGKFLKIVA